MAISDRQSTLPDVRWNHHIDLFCVQQSSGKVNCCVLESSLLSGWRGCGKLVPMARLSTGHSWVLTPLPAQVPGLRGREHLPACFPMATAGWRGIFPGSPDEWSLIAVGEGFASPAQCTTDSSWQAYEGGLRRPGRGRCMESASVAGCLYFRKNVFM